MSDYGVKLPPRMAGEDVLSEISLRRKAVRINPLGAFGPDR